MVNNFTYLGSVMSFDGEILEIFAVGWLKLHKFLAVHDIQSLLMILCWWELGELFMRQLCWLYCCTCMGHKNGFLWLCMLSV